MNLNCPKCHSEKIVKNGRTASNTQMYKCKNCNKYFTIQPLKKFPKTKLPFYFIINELRHFKDLKQVLGDDIKHGYLRNQFNQSYYFLEYHTEFPPKGSLTKSDSEKSGITRQRIYYWKKKYSKYLDDEEVVQEAKKFIAKRRKDILDGCPEEFYEQLVSFIDDIEVIVNEIKDDLDICSIGEIDRIENAYDTADSLADSLY